MDRAFLHSLVGRPLTEAAGLVVAHGLEAYPLDLDVIGHCSNGQPLAGAIPMPGTVVLGHRQGVVFEASPGDDVAKVVHGI